MTRVRIIDGDRLKSGDTDPNLKVQLRQRNDNPRDLSNSRATLRLAEVEDSDVVITDDTDATNGYIEYSWQPGDTDKVGTYVGEITVEEMDDSDTLTGDVRIQESLGGN